ncbi:CAP domain-containing protein [Paraliomyxa miuraensis]|uniref:CAP domain-containing protein n=1 Tax=Paraliomyxa miuraensis TaxID=376150 RepID=UPI0022540492|nr:CAP domain-containing protein [Paraliomyxa miuraensis]MCX4244847.1 hypothetical protein [Paraliomyxa miuraensis]
MRRWGFVVVVGAMAGCYVGPLDVGDGSTGDDSTGTMASSGSPSGPGDASAPGDASNGSTSDSGPMSTSGPMGSSGDSVDTGTVMDDSSGGDETTTGEMSGCEMGPLPEPIPGCAPAPPPSTGDIQQDCVDRINQFRWECQCLPPLVRWNAAEACTDDQSAADQNGGGPHGNFGSCGENAQNTCPNWGSEQQIISGCLQAMWDEGPGEPFSAHGHYINMSSTNYTKVACGFSSNGGGVWSNQNFAP